MKKKFIVPLLLGGLVLSIASCGGGGGGSSGEPQDPLDLGEKFNKEYYPVKTSNEVAKIIKGASGRMSINVALNFEGTEEAWKTLATEYMRLCGNVVDVNIIGGLDTGAYTDRVRIEEANAQTTWHIVQGNLLTNASGHCENLKDNIEVTNPYAGDKVWKDTLEEKAYITDVSGSTDTVYTLNSEDLLTAWFINTKTAKEAGVTETTPKTWEDLLAILQKYKDAGYTYPLGLSLKKDSITASQFAWLLRIYGDYYFRSNYQYITKSYDSVKKEDKTYTYDKTAQNPEGSTKYTVSYNRLISTMLDDGCDYYVGPKSSIYKDFVSNFKKLSNYISPSAYNYSFDDVRTSFKAQNNKEAPQIVIDYSGQGLAYLDASGLKDNLDFFDYPTMESEYVPTGTITRDVGGNGGYLSIFKYGSKMQKDLSKDFLKFVLSPYGQSIYYQALQKINIAPKGLTTVKNENVLIPDSWVEFFQTKKISYTGRADNNRYLTYGVLGLETYNSSSQTKSSAILWQDLLNSTKTYSVNDYAEDWDDILQTAWPKVASGHSWPEDAKDSSHYDNPTYIKD